VGLASVAPRVLEERLPIDRGGEPSGARGPVVALVPEPSGQPPGL